MTIDSRCKLLTALKHELLKQIQLLCSWDEKICWPKFIIERERITITHANQSETLAFILGRSRDLFFPLNYTFGNKCYKRFIIEVCTLISLLAEISLDSDRRILSLGLMPNLLGSTVEPLAKPSFFTYLLYKNLHSHNKNRANKAHPNKNIANVSIVKSPTPSNVHI